MDEDTCATCKSFSTYEKCAAKGYCLKHRKTMKRKDTCGYYRPDVKPEYVIECKPPEKSSAPPKSNFSF